MNEREESLNKSINIIKNSSENPTLKKMASLLEEVPLGETKVPQKTLKKLGQYTYEDYAKRKMSQKKHN